jgi:hypothetical protein
MKSAQDRAAALAAVVGCQDDAGFLAVAEASP